MRPIPLLALLVPAALTAQEGIPFSQHGGVLQVMGLDTITISYNRPVARGRRLFGHLVPWGHIWHPGADSATTVTFTKDLIVEGRPLAAGSYTLWTIPDSLKWTVIFSRALHVFHTPPPSSDFDVLRVKVKPEQGAHMEVMAFYFPVVGPDSATLRLHWGTTIVPIRLHAR
jgi:hypothetical protein